MELKLEVNQNFVPSNDTIKVGKGVIMMTPDITEDYWTLRVKLNNRGQAIVGFPKFYTIGVGFAKEEDWNTNLPFSVEPQKIYNHIKRNKGRNKITEAECITAIKMIQDFVKEHPEILNK